uniref:Exocyst complex component Sec10 n=1 Tax=Globodera pallida TaxID=36090 RepID=A0A183C015_GLOPA
MALLELFDEADDVDDVDEPPLRSADSAADRRRWLDELNAMQRPIDTLAGALREQLAALETEHRQKLQHCAIDWQNALNSSSFCGISGRKRRKLESLTGECRLRSTLLAEKIKNCSDYLHSFDTLIRSIQREQKRKSEEDDFLREFLLKSARHQHKKGQIGQALDTFCQLLLATGGHLSAEEMEGLADVCREKVRQTREFHERISQAVRQQLNESNSGRQNVVVHELWGQVLEDLRSECAESFEIVMQVNCDESNNTVGQSVPNCSQKHNTEQLKLLMASTICALWLHITPRGHEEFDDIKDLFFSTLDDYIETFRITNQKNCVKNVADDLEKTVRELMGNYPTVAGTKKMRKIAQRILII